MSKIKVAIVGVGNCASSLIQGIEYYRAYRKHQANGNNGKPNGKKKKKEDEHNFDDAFFGLMNEQVGGFYPDDIEVVAAFDIDTRKYGNH